jgi:hypothetical protein
VTFAWLELLAAFVFVPINTALMEWVPMGNGSLTLAMPLPVNCAWPSNAGPWQRAAVASQKLTRPGVTGLPPAFTVAVRTTGLGQTTEADETLSVVLVADCTKVSAPAVCSGDAGSLRTVAPAANRSMKVLTMAEDLRRRSWAGGWQNVTPTEFRRAGDVASPEVT